MNPSGITVVIPVHNSSSTLQQVVAPIIRELKQGDYLLAVDDRSTDSSVDILEELGVRTISSRGNPGAAGTRNTGCREAATEWVLFVDSDAVVPRGWRKMLQARMEQGEAVQGVYSRNAVGERTATFYKNYYYFHTFTRRIRGPYIKGCGTFFFAVKKNTFLLLDGFDENISGATIEDADFSERLWASGGRIVIAPEIEVFHLREYTIAEFFRYEWTMMKAKALYILRRDHSRGAPSVSVAGFREMGSVLVGAVFSWAFLIGLVLWGLGYSSGLPLALAGFFLTGAGQISFGFHMIKDGGIRGFLSCFYILPDLSLIIPAMLTACISYAAGKKY